MITHPAITLIVALDQKNGIGKGNQLLCHIPEDLAYFKATTMGATLLMGRKTYESIGRPLPGRKTVVLSKTLASVEGLEVINTLEQALAIARREEKIFVAGGGQIYKIFMPYATELLITRIEAHFEADTFFPEILEAEWNCNGCSPWQISRNGERFRFEQYRRTKKQNI